MQNIIANYSHENNALIKNLISIFEYGKLRGTNKLLVSAVDHGFEHGPMRSFFNNHNSVINSESNKQYSIYEPTYHLEYAIKCGLSAYAAPFGMLDTLYDNLEYYKLPKILKLNNAISLKSNNIDYSQAFTSSVKDAISLGCAGIGITIYPGSDSFSHSMQEIKEMIREAKANGLVVFVWSYPRGNGIENGYETALDVISYAAHIAALIGATIIKVKIPNNKLYSKKVLNDYNNLNTIFNINDISERIAYVQKSTFNGKKIILYSGGELKNTDELIAEVKAIKNGGGYGSMIGRNAFQIPLRDSYNLMNQIVNEYSK